MSFGPSADDKRRAFAKAYRLVHGGPDDDRGQSMIQSVIGITIGAIVIATIGSVGVNELANINLSAKNWSDGATSLFGIMDLIVVLGFMLLLIGLALTRRA